MMRMPCVCAREMHFIQIAQGTDFFWSQDEIKKHVCHCRQHNCWFGSFLAFQNKKLEQTRYLFHVSHVSSWTILKGETPKRKEDDSSTFSFKKIYFRFCVLLFKKEGVEFLQKQWKHRNELFFFSLSGSCIFTYFWDISLAIQICCSDTVSCLSNSYFSRVLVEYHN